jgi:ribosomal protein L11 methyltransferase
MKWIEVGIKTVHEGVDIMAQVLYEVGVKGVVIEDPADNVTCLKENEEWDLIDESLLKNLDEAVMVKGYLPNDASIHDNLQYVKERIQWLIDQNLGFDIGTGELSLSSMSDQDWANHWKKYFKPFKVGNRIVIKPTWEDYSPKEGEIILEMDPGMAFGTGTHETTILCIQALERLISPSCHILDIGCGTGILSIAALLLGAEHAVAVDIDGNAVRTARRNAALNGVISRMRVVKSDLLDEVTGKYDLIMANIIADVVIELSGSAKKYLSKDGILMASGIILERLQDVLDAVEEYGYKSIEHFTLGDWAVVVGRNA